MIAAGLLKHYDRIADAPDAVTKLRRFVLNLAVRGKLVAQLPKRESPVELPDQVPNDETRESDSPIGWRCAKLGAILVLQYGKGLQANDRATQGPIPVFGSNGIVGYTAEPLTANPSIIIGRKGSAGALKLCDGPSWTTDVAYFVEVPSFFNIRFLFNALASLNLENLGKGVKPGLSRSDAYAQDLWLPPLAEQRRIVAKFDELMALCDQLEAARAERETRRDRLAAASLARLNTPDPETFRDDARFALDALPVLTARPDQVKQLRQTILNLAIRGKLVQQCAKHEPAVLPARRQFAAASGMDEDVFKRFRDATPLPVGWQIAPLAQLSDYIVDCPHTTPKWTEKGEICVRTNQLRPGSLDLSKPRFVSPEAYLKRIERLEPRADDILYSREGGILGVACRVPLGVRLCLGQRLMLIRATPKIVDPEFLEIVLNSPFITEIAKILTIGGAAPRVNMSTVRAYPIPLPPVDEQRRIIGKVNELMALCNRLEYCLIEGQHTRFNLVEALLHEVLQMRFEIPEAA